MEKGDSGAKTMRRVLVTGGRNFQGREALHALLDRLHEEDPIEAIIHGAACGADTLASDWADKSGVKNIAHPADWKKHGLKAGPIRNVEMVIMSEPTLVVACPGGAGTAHMMGYAERKRLPIIKLKDQRT